VQKQWMEQVFTNKDCSQVNDLDSALKDGWKKLYTESEKASDSSEKVFYFSFVRESEEDLRNAQYMASCAQNAGYTTRLIYMDEISWNGQRFEDPQGNKIERLWKLYPWEWLTKEITSNQIPNVHQALRWLEPPWKMILSNKAILVVLWEMFPNHKNLLPTYFSPEPLQEKNLPIIIKPAAGREGANIRVRNSSGSLIYDSENYDEGVPLGRPIYQEWMEPPYFSSYTPVFSSWLINDTAAGIIIREDKHLITNNSSSVVPHVVIDPAHNSSIIHRCWNYVSSFIDQVTPKFLPIRVVLHPPRWYNNELEVAEEDGEEEPESIDVADAVSKKVIFAMGNCVAPGRRRGSWDSRDSPRG